MSLALATFGFFGGFVVFMASLLLIGKLLKWDKKLKRKPTKVKLDLSNNSHAKPTVNPEQVASNTIASSANGGSSFEKTTALTIRESAVYFLLSVAEVVGIFGLLYGIILNLVFRIFSEQQWLPSFQIDVIGIRASVSVFELLFIVFICLGHLNVQGRAFWVMEVRRQGGNWKRYADGSWPVNRQQINREFWYRITRKGNLLIPIAVLTWIQF